MSLKTAAADLSGLPEKLQQAALEAALEICNLIKGTAQVLVRVDTGSLRDSGRIERGGEGAHRLVVTVRFGGYVTNPRTGRLVDYAGIVERQFPYLRPAVNEYRDQMEDVIRSYCLAAAREVESHGVLRFR